MQCGQSYRNEPWRPRITAQLGLESTFPAYDVVSPNDEPKNGSRPPIPTQSDEMAIKQAIALPPLCGTEPYAVRTYERQSYVSSAIAELHISKLYYDRCRKLVQSNHFSAVYVRIAHMQLTTADLRLADHRCFPQPRSGVSS